MDARITLLPGDGIGPEVTQAAATILRQIAELGGHRFELVTAPIGGAAIDVYGDPLPAITLEHCADSSAILLGAVGGPDWPPGSNPRPEQGLLALRQHFGLFANLRPVPVFHQLHALSSLRPELLEDVDLLIVRELTGGLYFGPRQEDNGSGEASDTLIYNREEIERVAHLAFRLAQGRKRRVVSIDKANVLASMRLWRTTVGEVATHYPDVELEHALVDSFALRLLQEPSRFDVMLAGNLFGDILSDEAAILSGSLGLLPSASLNATGFGLYEPVHGSAPDIAGRGIANPIGAILSAAMLLRHSLGLEEEAEAVERAVQECLSEGLRTLDITQPGQTPASTDEVTAAVRYALTPAVII